MNYSKHDGVKALKKENDGNFSEFKYNDANVFKIPCSNMGPSVAIYYDRAAKKYSIEYCMNNGI